MVRRHQVYCGLILNAELSYEYAGELIDKMLDPEAAYFYFTRNTYYAAGQAAQSKGLTIDHIADVRNAII